MKAGLIGGLVLMLVSVVGIIACVVLVASTNGRVSGEEAMLVAVPLGILFVVSLALTGFTAVGLSKQKRKSV